MGTPDTHLYRGQSNQQASSKATSDPPCEPTPTQTAALQEKTQHLDSIIHQLHEQRAQIQRELNSIQSSPRNLPPEILAAIFEYTYPAIDFTTRNLRHSYTEDHPEDPIETLFIVKLAAVSSYWRQVALSTPVLWSTLRLDIRPIALGSNAAILRMFMDHCSPLPLSLEINRDPCTDYDEELLNGIRDLVLSHASRIRVLWLSDPPTTWPLTFSEKWGSFSALEDLRLGWPSIHNQDHETQGEIVLGNNPSLRRITLKNTHPKIELPWNSITTLNLYGIPIDTCIGLLFHCPNLIEYRSHVPADELVEFNSELMFSGSDEIKTLPNLQILEWSFHLSPWGDVLLPRLYLPNIHTLVLIGCYGYTPQSSFWQFIRRLPSTGTGATSHLRTLELARWPRWNYDAFRSLFGYMSHLEQLVMRNCGKEPFVDIFRALAPVSAITTESGETSSRSNETRMVAGLGGGHLPILNNLWITVSFELFNQISESVGKLLADVMERREGKGGGGEREGNEKEKLLRFCLDVSDVPVNMEMRGMKVVSVCGRRVVRAYDDFLGDGLKGL